MRMVKYIMMRLQSSTETNESDIMQMVKYAMIATVMMVGGLFLTGCGVSEYITREYNVRNEAQLREAFANVGNNEVVKIILGIDIELQGGDLRVPVGSTIIIDTPQGTFSNPPRSIIRVAGEERHFHVPYQATLNIRGNVTIQSQQNATNASAPTVNRGGITVNGGTLNTSGSITIRNNRWSEGGGVSVENGGTFNWNATGNISENVTSGNGGGVFVQGNSRFAHTGTGNISNNIAGGNGGGVFIQGNSSFSRNGTGSINENIANGNGGGIFIQGNSSFNRTGTGNINNNTAHIDGGGIFANGSDVRITISATGSISGNTAQRGGGVALLNGAHFTRTGTGSVSNNTGGNIDEIDDDSNLPINNEPNIIETPQPQPGGGNQRQ